MEIDLSQLRAIERDKKSPFDFLIKALEEALLNAEDRGRPPRRAGRAGSGRVAMVPVDEQGNVAREYDDTERLRSGRRRHREVIFQRLLSTRTSRSSAASRHPRATS